MSPGVTFERVYRELKRRLADGTLRPGQPIEPAQMSAELAASITPIRDALHRLVGERLVEAPNHNGFRVPRLTEAELRDLYLWNGRVVELAVRQIRPEAFGDIAMLRPDIHNAATALADLFRQIAKATGSDEHLRALTQLHDRLAPYRRVEPRALGNVTDEHDTIVLSLAARQRSQLMRALARIFRRRVTAAPAILAAAATG